MEDRLKAIEAAWRQTKATQDEYEVAGRINGFDDLPDYVEFIYDQAIKDLGDDVDGNLPEYFDNEVRQTIDHETAVRDEWLSKSNLCRMHQWRIRHRPLDQWRGHHRQRKADVPVRLINIPAITRCLAGDEPEGDGVRLEFFDTDGFGFLDLIIYSTICSFWDRGIKSITMRSLLEHLNPAEQWRRQDHTGFIYDVKASIDRITSIWVEINVDGSNLIDSEVVDDSIIIKDRSKLWDYAEGKAGIISIPGEWLKSGKCRIGWLDRMYVARRVRLSIYQNSTMPSKINLASMFKALGHNVSPDRIMSYLGHLERLGAIVGSTIDKGTVSWTPCEKTKA